MNSRTARKYSRISSLYDLVECPVERLMFQRFREKAAGMVQGKTLEAGVGTGKNFSYYRRGLELTAIDFSEGMLRKAGQRMHNLGMENITILQMDVQNLSFPDNFFDTVISTFVFCTVPEPLLGLKELHRVLKPSGKAVFLEHMKSSSSFINLHLYVMNMFTAAILGTSMLRETQKYIELAGFSIQSVENLASDVVRLIVAGK
ncbi:MAG: class I SAM-dependent methyltransferase [Spirochaetota bacterium]